jgi:phage/plasmid-associated DNA primase
MPFDVTIPPEKRKRNYFEQFRPELGGILQDLIEGCIEWQRIGLRPPAAVTAATEDYFRAQDRITRFVEECCVVVGKRGTTAAETTETEVMSLYAAWTIWAEKNGERPGSLVVFVEALKATGRFRHSPNEGRTRAEFHGIELSAEAKREVEENERRRGV